jgi:hypothetical protein
MVVKTGRSAGQKMGVITLEDSIGTAECVVFSDAFAKFGHLAVADQIVFVLGRIDLSRGSPQVITERLVPILKQSADKLAMAKDVPSQRNRALAAIALAEVDAAWSEKTMRDVIVRWWRGSIVPTLKKGAPLPANSTYALFELLHVVRDNLNIDLRDQIQGYFRDLPLQHLLSYYPAAFPGAENELRRLVGREWQPDFRPLFPGDRKGDPEGTHRQAGLPAHADEFLDGAPRHLRRGDACAHDGTAELTLVCTTGRAQASARHCSRVHKRQLS